MGKHELEHLRKEAEQAIADAERWSDNEGSAAIAKTLMYGFALLADRMPAATDATESLTAAVKGASEAVQWLIDNGYVKAQEAVTYSGHPPKIEIKYHPVQDRMNTVTRPCDNCRHVKLTAWSFSMASYLCADCWPLPIGG